MELLSLYALKFCEHTHTLKNINTCCIDQSDRYQFIIMVHSLLSQMLKMSANISLLLIMMCNRSEYFLQSFKWIGSKYSFVSQVLQCSSEHPTISTRRGAMSIQQESEHSKNFSHHCGNVVMYHCHTNILSPKKQNYGRYSVALQHGFVGSTCDICFQEKTVL
jgi:hypothetical protein